MNEHMASHDPDQWQSLLERKEKEVSLAFGKDFEQSKAIFDGRSFREKFEEFCKSRKVYKTPPLLAFLHHTYKPIEVLTESVRKSASDLQSTVVQKTLGALIWRLSFALIKCGYDIGIGLHQVIDMISAINKRVSEMTTDQMIQVTDLQQVQKPLQDICNEFIDSHILILNYWQKENTVEQGDNPDANLDLNSHIDLILRQVLDKARSLHDELVTQATSVRQVDIRQATTRQTHLRQAHSNSPAGLELPFAADRLSSRSTRGQTLTAEFVYIKELGHGSFGQVDAVKELTTGILYARKNIYFNNDNGTHTQESEVRNEVAVMQKLRHMHIAQVCFYSRYEGSYCIIMLPVADYDLERFLIRCTKENYPIALMKPIYSWIGCILSALAYAHKLKIKHRDIKPSNILIKDGQPFLSDFGLAKDTSMHDTSASGGDDVHGTAVYRAPEVVAGGHCGRKADVFSLGCVYSEILTVCQEQSLNAYRAKRLSGGSASPAFRYTLSEVHAWMQALNTDNKLDEMLVEQISCMIEADQEQRPTAEEAENFFKRDRAFFCVE